jgi:hypothetical protein
MSCIYKNARLIFALRKALQSRQYYPIAVAEWSKTRGSGRSLAGVAGSKPAGGMDVCVVCVEQ